MSTVTPLNSAPFPSAAIAQDEPESLQWVPPLTDRRDRMKALRLLVKRTIDLVGATVGLLLLAPLMFLIGVLIRLDSRGPALFRQVRLGYRGRPFWMLKFRTMTVDAEAKLGDLEESNESHGGVLFKLSNDPRVTRLGALLRRTSLDELPQLINVLRGEMSLVGPRPLQVRDSDRLAALNPRGYQGRLQVPPGVTGPWQISGRKDVDYQRMIQLDLDYVGSWSLGSDLWILLKTFFVVLLGKGAY
ncbi:MAG TPA: sugar transferase [Isosphaeraceae bacterium]|nr:sugar transferase [Isosphaeraceae bacterium]